ncbi:hypothetical protein MXB_1885, partial [Myxobolus squamalis]
QPDYYCSDLTTQVNKCHLNQKDKITLKQLEVKYNDFNFNNFPMSLLNVLKMQYFTIQNRIDFSSSYFTSKDSENNSIIFALIFLLIRHVLFYPSFYGIMFNLISSSKSRVTTWELESFFLGKSLCENYIFLAKHDFYFNAVVVGMYFVQKALMGQIKILLYIDIFGAMFWAIVESFKVLKEYLMLEYYSFISNQLKAYTNPSKCIGKEKCGSKIAFLYFALFSLFFNDIIVGLIDRIFIYYYIRANTEYKINGCKKKLMKLYIPIDNNNCVDLKSTTMALIRDVKDIYSHKNTLENDKKLRELLCNDYNMTQSEALEYVPDRHRKDLKTLINIALAKRIYFNYLKNKKKESEVELPINITKMN